MTEPNGRHLPAEIVEEILYNLPVKSLNRFRCVSKPWQSLISENRFARKHLNRDNLSRKTLILSNPVGSATEKLHCFSLSSFQSMHRMGDDRVGNYWQLLASCDGLLCIRNDRSVYMWNPCLKMYRTILTPTGKQTFYDFSTSYFGLGYDSIRDDYKLFKLSNTRRGSKTETEVYSLKSDSWKKLDNFPPDYLPLRSVFVNGSIHWLAFRGDLRPNPFSFFSFDLSDNKYRELCLPECRSNYHLADVKPCVLKGMLCVLVKSTSLFVLWAMKDYYSDRKSWTKILDIRFELVFDKYCGPVDVEPFYMYENGNVLIGVVSMHGTELLICEDDSVLFRKIIFRQQSLIRYGFVHVESLISPNPVGDVAGTSKDDTVKNGDKEHNRSIMCCIWRFSDFVLTCLGRLFSSSC